MNESTEQTNGDAVAGRANNDLLSADLTVEPVAYLSENGKWHISVGAEQLTTDCNTESDAWQEYVQRHKGR